VDGPPNLVRPVVEATAALGEKWNWRCPGGRAGILGCDDVSKLNGIQLVEGGGGSGHGLLCFPHGCRPCGQSDSTTLCPATVLCR
jgi:hypothetical protein